MSDTPRLDTDAVIKVASFRAALRSFLGDSDRVARASGLTPQRHLLLLMIKGAPDGSERATVTELADRLRARAEHRDRTRQRAEKLGLIEREPSETDGRVAYLRLTAEGERRLAKAFVENEATRTKLRRALNGTDT